MRRSIVFATDALFELFPVAKSAEEAGFHRIWTTEYTTRDALIRAMALAANTQSIKVGTGISYAFTRSPLAMSAAFADAYVLSGGRLTLGLGAGTKGMRRNSYGIEDFDRPGPRMSEYVAFLRAAWAATDGLEFKGEFYNARIPLHKSPHSREVLAGIEVFGSGLNRIMLREAASSYDGVALHPLASEIRYLDDVVLPAVAEGTARSGRDTEVKLAVWKVTSIAEDESVALERAKLNLAFYFSTPSYASVVAGTEWEHIAGAIQNLFREMGFGVDWTELAATVPDEMAEAFVLFGTRDVVRRKLAVIESELAERGVDEIVFQTVGVGLATDEVVRNCSLIVESFAPKE